MMVLHFLSSSILIIMKDILVILFMSESINIYIKKWKHITSCAVDSKYLIPEYNLVRVE